MNFWKLPPQKKSLILVSIGMILFFVWFGISSAKRIMHGMTSLEAPVFYRISECKEWKNKLPEGAVLTETETGFGDFALKDLQCKDFFAAEYRSDEVNFEICAYQFSSREDALQFAHRLNLYSLPTYNTSYHFYTKRGKTYVWLWKEGRIMGYSFPKSFSKSEIFEKTSDVFSDRVIIMTSSD